MEMQREPGLQDQGHHLYMSYYSSTQMNNMVSIDGVFDPANQIRVAAAAAAATAAGH